MPVAFSLLPNPPRSFLKKYADIHPVLAILLWQRNIRKKNEIEEFLNPSYYQQEKDKTGKYDPFDFKEMDKVVVRLLKAAHTKERVLVYGDYDADGVCSAILMIETLEKLYGVRSFRQRREMNKKSDSTIQVYLPHREEEGYGLNSKAVDYIKEQAVSLVITCDCGSGNTEELKKLKELAIDTIVLDHHLAPKARPPAYGFINPKFTEEKYTFYELAGCGVVFKVIQGLRYHLQKSQKKPVISESFEKWSLDLVALATVADMMPLTAENRLLVKWGLVVLNKTRRIGLRALINSAGLTKKIGAYEISFAIAPRINAAGRLDHANVAFDLLRQDDLKKVTDDAEKLTRTNEARQRLTEKIFREAKTQLGDQIKNTDTVLVAYNTEMGAWPMGMVGLVAGKLAQAFFRPSFVVANTKHGFAGSGRSIHGFDITDLLESMRALFTNAGGHPAAAGFTFKADGDKKNLIAKFKKMAEKYAKERLSEQNLQPTSIVDVEIPFSVIDWELAHSLARMEPFGQGNREPLFFTRAVTVDSVRYVGAKNETQKLTLSSKGIQHPAIIFRSINLVSDLKKGDVIDVSYKIDVNEWRGSKTIELVIKGLNFAILKN